MNNKTSKNIRTITLFLITMLCFGAMGYCIGMLIKQDGRHANHIILLRLGYSMLWAFIGIFASVIIHESGHLVMGLRSGYDFVSFRIGSFVWIKQDGKLVCSGKGTKTNFEYQSENAEPDKTVDYTDGSAEFSMEGSHIVWNDLNENSGEDMMFSNTLPE